MKRRQFIMKSAFGGGLFLSGAPWDTFSTPSPDLKTLRKGPVVRSDTGDIKHCEIKKYNNQSTMFLKGEPQFPLTYYTKVFDKARFQNMREHGIRFFGVYISLGDRHETGYTNGKVRLHTKGIWDHPGKIDFETLDASISEVVSAVPDAHLILRVSCNSPCWWDSYHPAETCRTYQSMLPMRQSFSSIVWRRETAQVLQRILTHIQSSAYAGNVVGIDILFGESNEGRSFGWLGAGDYSHAAREGFRSWLKQRYGGMLTQGYEPFDKPIDQLDIPVPKELMKSEHGNFLDPVNSKLAIEYRLFRGMEIVESLDYLCGAVKNASKGNLIAGGSYGSVFSHSYDQMALSEALTRKNIDFLSCTGWQTLPDSLQRLGKVFCHHSTLTTPLSKTLFEAYPAASPYGEVIKAPEKKALSMRESLENLKFEFGKAVLTGSMHTFMDPTGGAFDDDNFFSLFAAMQRVGNEMMHKPRKSVAEVCVIVNESSFIHHAPLTKKQEYQNLIIDDSWISSQMKELDRIGAPYDAYLQSDLDSLNVSGYKMFIFLNPAVLTHRDRENIKRSCMGKGRTLLWLFAPGYVNDDIAIDNVTSLLNVRLRVHEKTPPSAVVVKAGRETVTYEGAEVSPFVTIEDSQVKPCGFSRDGSLVLAQKKEENYTNILATMPPLPWTIIQSLAEQSNVHIYEKKGATILVNESFVAVKKAIGEDVIIEMPNKCTLTDVLSSVDEAKVSRQMNKSRKKNRIHLRFDEGETVRLLHICS